MVFVGAFAGVIGFAASMGVAKPTASGTAAPSASSVASAGPISKLSSRCKERISANYGRFGNGLNALRLLYPQLEEQTFVVAGDTPTPLLDCDMMVRAKPSPRLAVLLVFPADRKPERLSNTYEYGTLPDVERFELALIGVDSSGKLEVVRGRDVLSQESLLADASLDAGSNLSLPLPITEGAHFERAEFATKIHESAVAIRFESSDACQGWNAILLEYGDLALFMPGANGLSLVLRLHMKETSTIVHCDSDASPSCGSSTTVRYSVKVGRHTTAGMPDIMYRAVREKWQPPERLQWNGSHYARAR